VPSTPRLAAAALKAAPFVPGQSIQATKPPAKQLTSAAHAVNAAPFVPGQARQDTKPPAKQLSSAANALKAPPFVPGQDRQATKPTVKRLSSEAPAYVPPHGRGDAPEQQSEESQPTPDGADGASPAVKTGDWASADELTATEVHGSAAPAAAASVAKEEDLVQPAATGGHSSAAPAEAVSVAAMEEDLVQPATSPEPVETVSAATEEDLVQPATNSEPATTASSAIEKDLVQPAMSQETADMASAGTKVEDLVQPDMSLEPAAETVEQQSAALAAAVVEPSQTNTVPLSPPALSVEAEQPTATADGPAAGDAIMQEADGSATAVVETETAPLLPPSQAEEAELPTSTADGTAAGDAVMEEMDDSAAPVAQPAQAETATLSPPAVSEAAEQPTAAADSPAAGDTVIEDEADDSAEEDKPPRDTTESNQDQAAPTSDSYPPNSTIKPPLALPGGEMQCECRMFSFGDFSPVDMSNIITTVGFPTERLVPVDRAAAAQPPGNLTFGYAAPAEQASKDSGGSDGGQQGQGSLSLPPEHPTVSSPMPAHQADSTTGDSRQADMAEEGRDHGTHVNAASPVTNRSKDDTQPKPDSPNMSSVPSGAAAESPTAAAQSTTENKLLAAQPVGEGETPAQSPAQVAHDAEEKIPAGDAALLAASKSPEPASVPKHSTAPTVGDPADNIDSKASAPPTAAAAPAEVAGPHATNNTDPVKVWYGVAHDVDASHCSAHEIRGKC